MSKTARQATVLSSILLLGSLAMADPTPLPGLVVGLASTRLDARTANAISKGEIAGVLLMGRNLRSRSQVRKLTNDLRYAASHGGQVEPLIMLDQEGGAVDRLVKVLGYRTPSARRLGRRGEAAVRNSAYRSAKAMKQLGINVNLAPVADLTRSATRSVIGSRSYGDDPERVAKLAAAFVEASQAVGVAACLKHYPGHGATLLDTHKGPVVVRSPESTLFRHRLAFDKALAAKPKLVMVGHVVYREWDASVPASASPKILSVLRQKAPDTVIVTDSGAMGGMGSLGSEAQRAARALRAGADLYLTTTTLRSSPHLPKRVKGLLKGKSAPSDRVRQLREALAKARDSEA